MLTALQDVENALVAQNGDREHLLRVPAAAAAAADAEWLAGRRHASGLIDFRTVFDTQRSLLTTQASVAGPRGQRAQ